jgi:hypothetical protein
MTLFSLDEMKHLEVLDDMLASITHKMADNKGGQEALRTQGSALLFALKELGALTVRKN